MMKRIAYLFLSCFFTLSLNAQVVSDAAIIQPIQQLFDGMRLGDSAMVRAVFLPAATLESAFTDRSGKPQLKSGSIDQFVQAIGEPHEEVWDEKIWSYEIKQDGRMASVWTEYTFYVGEKMSHCGVNAFQLFNGANGWKIKNIMDTRRRENCQEDPKVVLDQLMDAWHKAAAEGDEEVFFDSMGDEAIYIGTDATERWRKKEFEAWSKKYFDRDSAWDFTPIERAIYFSKNKEVAWFNETLNTWMGVCRGSGVIEKVDGVWKLQHYHLAMTIPNEKVEAVLKLMKE